MNVLKVTKSLNCVLEMVKMVNYSLCIFYHIFLKSILYSLHIFGDFPVIFLLLICSLVPLWSVNVLYMTSILLRSLTPQNKTKQNKTEKNHNEIALHTH